MISRDRGIAYLVVLPLLFLSSCAGEAAPQHPPAIEGQASLPFQISVDVDLVVLNPVVRDRSGGFVSDLREEDFQIYEDGVRQSIKLFRHEDIPVTVGLVVDHSASMGPKMAEVTAAARTFARSSNPADEMFVVNFNEKVSLGLAGTVHFTSRPDQIEGAILWAPITGQTALYDAVIAAREQLRTGSFDKKVLIVISDGGDNASSHSLAEALKIAGESGALVYTIGIFDADNPDRNPNVLRRLAQTTGGEAFFPEQLNEVVAICESIARDVRNQYTIGYVSANTSKGDAWRSIRVVASPKGHGKLVVRARAGYTPDGRGTSGTGGPK